MIKTLVVLILVLLTACDVDEGNTPIGSQTSNPIDVAFSNGTTMLLSNANSNQDFFNNASILAVNISNPTAPQVITSISTPLFNGKLAANAAVLPGQLFFTNRLSFDDLDVTDEVFNYNLTNPATPSLSRTVLVADDPFGITIVPAGFHQGRVLVAHVSTGVIFHFNGNNAGETPGSINLASEFFDGSFSTEVAVSPDGNRAAVTNIIQNVVYILDLTPPDDLTVEARINTFFNGVAVNDTREVHWIDNDRFAMANRSLSNIFIANLSIINEGNRPLADDGFIEDIEVNINNAASIQAIPLTPFSAPTGLEVVGNNLFVSQNLTNTISRIDLNSFTVSDPISSGGVGPVGIEVEPSGRFLYVANQNSSNVGIIDVAEYEFIRSFP